jgi:LacI family transcriptional regulator
MTPYASLKDVAALSGVSFQTASKVLNGRDGAASPRTAERVLDAARQLGYVPSATGRRLVGASSPLIGIISDGLSDSGLAQFLEGAQRAVHARGVEALVVIVQPGGDSAASVRKLLEHRVDGIMVIAPSVEHQPGFAKALVAAPPVVSLNRFPDGNAFLVGSDHAETGALAAAHLIECGHRRIATITGSSTRAVVGSRLRGFRSALAQTNVRLPPRRIAEADWTVEGAHGAMHGLLDADPSITAVFVHSDVMAVGVLRALADRGIRVPEECSVISCDDLPFAAYLTPGLTTVKIPFQETGARAAELLLDRLGGADIPLRELLPVRLVIRNSTAAPATAGRATRRTVAERRSAGRPLVVSQEG